MKILAIDFEGTNREPRRGCPVQIGVCVMDGETVEVADEWLIRPPTHWKSGKPTKEVDAYSLRVSGLTLEDIEENGLPSEESCVRLAQFVKTNVASSLPVVAFSMSYDIECYERMLYDGGQYSFEDREYYPFRAILGAKWVCARQMARLMLPALMHYSLDDVAEFFGLVRDTENHEACADAILAGKVYARLRERAMKSAEQEPA